MLHETGAHDDGLCEHAGDGGVAVPPSHENDWVFGVLEKPVNPNEILVEPVPKSINELEGVTEHDLACTTAGVQTTSGPLTPWRKVAVMEYGELLAVAYGPQVPVHGKLGFKSWCGHEIENVVPAAPQLRVAVSNAGWLFTKFCGVIVTLVLAPGPDAMLVGLTEIVQVGAAGGWHATSPGAMIWQVSPPVHVVVSVK